MRELGELEPKPRQPLLGGLRRARRARHGARHRIVDLARDRVALGHRAAHVVAVQPELGVQPLQGGEVDLDLLRQLPRVALLELADLPLLLVEAALHLGELDLQELGGARRLLLADLEVLLDVEGGEGIRHQGDVLGVAAPVADREGDGLLPLARLGALELEPDVPPHPLDDLFGRGLVPEVWIEREPVDQALQPRRGSGSPG